MNYYTLDDLVSALKDVTHHTLLKSEGEPVVVVSEYGGRPLGLFPTKTTPSLLWINHNVQDTIKSLSWDIGGERYWISPERMFFYEDPENWKGWFCPSGLDPADYRIVEKSDEYCKVQSKISLINQVNKAQYEGEVIRKFKILKESVSTGLNYCGIELHEECWLKQKELNINGWSLATVFSQGPKNPGTVIIPTKANSKPLSYFRTIPNDRMTIGENYVAFKIDVDDIYKLAIRPEDINYDIPAKIGYVTPLPNSQDYGFLVKLSDNIPKSQKECHDISRDHPDMEVGVIQSYNSESNNKAQLNFGEIELQLNPFITIDKTSVGKAKHQLLSYVGSKDDILGVAEKYFKIDNPQLF